MNSHEIFFNDHLVFTCFQFPGKSSNKPNWVVEIRKRICVATPTLLRTRLVCSCCRASFSPTSHGLGRAYPCARTYICISNCQFRPTSWSTDAQALKSIILWVPYVYHTKNRSTICSKLSASHTGDVVNPTGQCSEDVSVVPIFGQPWFGLAKQSKRNFFKKIR